MFVRAWPMTKPGEAMAACEREERAGPGEVLVEVAGCGVCHTDLGFFYDGVPIRHELPLTLGHEISGVVVEAGEGVGGGPDNWVGRSVVVPAVIPCGSCPACAAGRGSVCPKQIFPGNDVHGGFASHVRVPAQGLCALPALDDPAINPRGIELRTLSVIADAVSTPYQAILRSELRAGDLAVFVGVGGVGGFGVQVAAALGAVVVAIDVDPGRLEAISHLAALTLRADELDFKQLRNKIRELCKAKELPSWRHKIFETSGTTAGQATAFGLIGHGAYLSVVGFTAAKLELRLSNLMAYDAKAEGNWGCLPEHYPAIVDMVLSGAIELDRFVEVRPLSSINETFADIHAHRVSGRVILVPDP